MRSFRSILFVCDAATSDAALARVASLADHQQARLTIIDVVAPLASAEQTALLVLERHRALEALCAPFRALAASTIEVSTGKRFVEAIRRVLRDNHDLLVKSAENPSWTERLFGSEDMHLLRKCPCPVWLMRPDEEVSYRTVLAAIDVDPDVSDDAQELNDNILELASALAVADFAALHVLHVWDSPEAGFVRLWADDPASAERSVLSGASTRHREAAERQLGRLAQSLGSEAYRHLAPKLHVIHGNPRDTIPAQAAQLGAQLVVMGTVARKGVAGVLIGNTAEDVLDQLRCAVLALKPAWFASPLSPPAI